MSVLPALGQGKGVLNPLKSSVIGVPIRSTGWCPIPGRRQSGGRKLAEEQPAMFGLARVLQRAPLVSTLGWNAGVGGGIGGHTMGVAHVRELCSHTTLRQLQGRIHPCPREWH